MPEAVQQQWRCGLLRHSGGNRVMAQVLALVPTAGLEGGTGGGGTGAGERATVRASQPGTKAERIAGGWGITPASAVPSAVSPAKAVPSSPFQCSAPSCIPPGARAGTAGRPPLARASSGSSPVSGLRFHASGFQERPVGSHHREVDEVAAVDRVISLLSVCPVASPGVEEGDVSAEMRGRRRAEIGRSASSRRFKWPRLSWPAAQAAVGASSGGFLLGGGLPPGLAHA